MKKKRLRIIGLMCALLMGVEVVQPMQNIPVFAVTALDENSSQWEYSIVYIDGVKEAWISKCPKDSGAKVVVPKKLDDLNVTGIGYGVFTENTTLEEIELPSTMKSICSSAFAKCSSLKKVTFLGKKEDEEVEKLEVSNYAFNKCEKLEQITWPKNAKKIMFYAEAMAYCSSLKSMEIPCKSQVYQDAFKGNNFTSLIFKDDVVLERYALASVFGYEEGVEKSLKFQGNVDMVEGLLNTSRPALYSNVGLTEIEFDKEVILCQNAFQACSNLKKIVWGTKLTSTYEKYGSNTMKYVFYGCNSLKEFVFQKKIGGSEIVLDGFSDTEFPKLEKVVFEGDVRTNIWFTATEVICKGKITVTQNEDGHVFNYVRYLPEQKIGKEKVYLYDSSSELYGFQPIAMEFYAMTKEGSSEIEKLKTYVSTRPECEMKNLVVDINMTKAVNQITVSGTDNEIKITPQKLAMQVEAMYADGSSHLLMQGDGKEGYLFSADEIVVDGKVNCSLSYAGIIKTFTVDVVSKKLTKLEVEVHKTSDSNEVVTFPAGENRVSKQDITVWAVYQDGSRVDVTNQATCKILPHNIQENTENHLYVCFEDSTLGQSLTQEFVVKGKSSKKEDHIEVTYNGFDGNGLALVQVALQPKDFSVYQVYNNGDKELLDASAYEVSGQAANIGENNVKITVKSNKQEKSLKVKVVAIDAMYVEYVGAKKGIGDVILPSEFSVQATYNGGQIIKTTAYSSSDIRLSKTKVDEEDREKKSLSVVVTLAGKSQSVEVPIAAKTLVNTEIVLKDDKYVANIATGVPASAFVVKNTYSDGSFSLVEAKEISVETKNLTVGENQVKLIYVDKEYWVSVRAQRVEFEAVYVGNTTIYPGDKIKVSELEVYLISFDGQQEVKTRLEESNYTVDESSATVYIEPYQLSVAIDGISAARPLEPTSSPGMVDNENGSVDQQPTGDDTEKKEFVSASPKLKLSSTGSRFKLVWNYNGKIQADQYQVLCSTDKKNYKKIASLEAGAKQMFYVNKQAKQGTKLYFTVVACKSIGGELVKVKSNIVGRTLISQVKNCKMKVKKTLLTFSWKNQGKYTGVVLTLKLKNNGKVKTKKFVIAKKKKISFKISTIRKKYGFFNSESISIVNYSIRQYYKKGKEIVYSEK